MYLYSVHRVNNQKYVLKIYLFIKKKLLKLKTSGNLKKLRPTWKLPIFFLKLVQEDRNRT